MTTRSMLLARGAACALVAALTSSAVSYQRPAEARMPQPAAQKAAVRDDNSAGGRRLGFVVTYFYFAMYQGKDACPAGTNPMITTQQFLASKPAAERDRLLLPQNKAELYTRIVERGPKGENLCKAPWAAKDAPMLTLEGDHNDGLDLDGWKGTGAVPAGICPQKQYIDADGGTGIDNQLGRVYACVNGLRQKGTLEPYFTQAMRNGLWSMLIDVSGVQDVRNDPDVTVDVYAGQDTMPKDPSGKVLAGASLSPVDDPRLHARLKGKIVDGVLTTEPVTQVTIPDIMTKRLPPTPILQARFRLTLLPDGTAKGLFGGYRTLDTLFKAGQMNGEDESYMGYTCEGMYSALHRFADGGRNPKTGRCDSISVAYKVEAIPAFIVHPKRRPAPSFADAGGRR